MEKLTADSQGEIYMIRGTNLWWRQNTYVW